MYTGVYPSFSNLGTHGHILSTSASDVLSKYKHTNQNTTKTWHFYRPCLFTQCKACEHVLIMLSLHLSLFLKNMVINW